MAATDYSEPAYDATTAFEAYPGTEEGWRALYDWRWQQYLMGAYNPAEQKSEHLFRAFDDTGKEIDQTKRLFRFYGFVVDTDARALHGGGLTLETHDRKPGQAKDAQLLAGEAVWRRSRLNGVQLPRWCRMLCALGDFWIEAVRMSKVAPYRTTLVGYDPRGITATYDDETGTELVKVVYDTSVLPEPMQSQAGPMGAMKNYRRVLTKDRIEVFENGKLVSSGAHNLGHVPCVHMQALAWDQPEHGLPAPFGIERALMRLDSIWTQGGAVANRFGNPTFVTYGFKLGAGSKVSRFGRMIDGAPADGKAEYVEAGLTAMGEILPWMQALIDHVRDTTPEFLFASDAAQESAASRSLRGQAFESKMLEMRANVYGALAEVTAMAVAMDARQPLDMDTIPFKIDAPPVLPRQVGAEVETLLKVEKKIKAADFTRHLQRLGVVGNEHDPDAYTAEVQDEQSAIALNFFNDPNATPDPNASADPVVDPAAVDPATPAANTALNGAQVTSALEIVTAVATGQLPRDTGVAMLIEFFNIDKDRAERVMGAVGKAFTPAVADPAAP